MVFDAQATPRKSSPDGNQIFPSGNTAIREDGFQCLYRWEPWLMPSWPTSSPRSGSDSSTGSSHFQPKENSLHRQMCLGS